MILSCFILSSVVLLQTVSASVPLVEIMLSGTTNNQNCENKCVISQTVTVQKGTAVEWINNDLIPHTLVSGQPGDLDNGTLFDTGPIWVGKFTIHNFNDVGVYYYFERDHPENTGIINVINGTYLQSISEITTGLNATSGIESPLKQFKSGISALDVKCNQGLQLILKSEDGFPACVKSDTSQILIKRGWGVEGLVPHPGPAKSSP